jgi:microsomal dipeptidase-like Zn-dependent dipeptidase
MTVWGFADLHAHPASHLAFGATAQGEWGVFHGKPGLKFEDSFATLPSDLPPCAPDKHARFDEDPVRHGTRIEVVNNINSLTGHPHQSAGWPNFEGWPHARSVLHQQMHISWVHRAWLGGLRLMIASVTENETLAMLWHRSYGAPRPGHDPNYDYHSARRQLTFIHNLVAANSDWMQIVTSPSEARSAIAANKLAVILSVEMDSFSVEQIVTLSNDFGVRDVIPIHLIDNDFGGVAVYSDLFNSHNHYVNGKFYQALGEATITFRLGRPNRLKYITGDPFGGGDLFKHGAMEPEAIGDAEYRALAYPSDQGHRNSRGLVGGNLLALMQHGFLLDMAHMSDASQEGALQLAEIYNYPLMNSHTGLRPDDATSFSERSMRRGLAVRVARLGGVLGLGTEGILDGDPVANWIAGYRDALGLMGNRGVALGTDMNGYAPQIPSSAQPVLYPINVAQHFYPDPSSPNRPPLLNKHQLGSRRPFDFTVDGIAHYGMLPDFLQALHQHMGDGLAAMFRTAEDVIQMWERVENAKQKGLAASHISYWLLDGQGNQVGYKEYGPYPDWMPLNCADNRILWRHKDGLISLWQLDEQGNQISYKRHYRR